MMDRDALSGLAWLGEPPDEASPPRQPWLRLAASALTPQTLIAFEQFVYAAIDERYPDDRRSLLNRRHREGQRLKKRWRAFFDAAHEQLVTSALDAIARARGDVHAHQLAAMDDALYLERRPAHLTRLDDDLAHAIRSGLAYNEQLQADLARSAAEERAKRKAATRQHRQAIETRRVEAEIAQAQRALDRPQELLLKLYEVLTGLMQYQMALADRASRNPALADRLQMMSIGLGAVMASVQGLITELNRMGPVKPAPEQIRQQSERILAMALEQLQQWQQETRSETGA